MGSCCQGDAPQPPNPAATAAAQTGTNVSTAVANQQLGQVNQVTPQGSLTYNNTGTFTWVDPSTGYSYSIPKSTVTQTLSPTQQHISDLGQQAQGNLAQLAANQSGTLTSLLGSPLNTSGAPRAGDPNSLAGFNLDTSYGDPNDRQLRTFGDAGAITRDYGPADNFSADRQRVEQAMFKRLDPQLERDRQRLDAQLRDKGFLPGSAGYQAEMDQLNRNLTDTRLGITERGGQEQKLLNDMAAQRAGFQNAAQKQAFEQAQGRATFANAAQQQDYTQAALRGQFKNDAIGKQMAMAQSRMAAEDTARKQWLSEQYAARQAPINEITALMSGSQVQQPNWVSTQGANIPTTDYAGLVNSRFNQDMQNYQQSSQNFNQIMGGIFGAVAGLTMSDRRVKDVGDKVGTVFAAGHDGEKPLPVYEYKYKDDPTRAQHVGPMAQDVERVDKKAVKTIGGTKYIDRTRLGSILKVNHGNR